MRPSTDKRRIKILSSLFFILLITFVAFSPSLENGFTNWDDEVYVTENQDIKSLNQENLKKIFTSQYVAMYLPVTMLSYSLDYYFFDLNPRAYHTTSLIIHLLNCILVFYLFLLLSENTLSSFIIAILFGIHPLHVESVAWISERKDVLCCLFFLAGLINYIYYKKREKKLFYIISLIAFILSLMSKTMSITLPLILVIIERFFHNKTRNPAVEKIPFFLISAVFGIIAFLTQTEAMEKHSSLTFLDNLCIASYGILFYLYKTIFPLNLSAFYPYPEKTGNFLPAHFLISSFIVIILAVIIIFSGKYTKKIIFGSLFFLITILPVIKIVPIGDAMAADRYTYIPLLGIFYILGEGFYFFYSFFNRNKQYEKTLKFSLVILLIAVILMLSGLTYSRCYIWRDSITLWSDVLKNYPLVAFAYYNRGNAYFSGGDYKEAIKDYSQTIYLDPEYLMAYHNRGNIYYYYKNYHKAISDYNHALSINPNFITSCINRGNVYLDKGDYKNAITDYNRALKIDPDSPDAYINRGILYSHIKEYDKALSDFNRVLELNPFHFHAYYNRALTYIAKGEYEKAIQDINKIKDMGYQCDSLSKELENIKK